MMSLELASRAPKRSNLEQRPCPRVDRHAIDTKGKDYFLCRCRLRSFRCLCLRIFLRRFLITLPTIDSPCPAKTAERAHV